MPKKVWQLPEGTARGAAAIAPNDGANLPRAATYGIYNAVAGNIRMICMDDSETTIAVPANYVLRVAVKKVFATNTTATGLQALFA